MLIDSNIHFFPLKINIYSEAQLKLKYILVLLGLYFHHTNFILKFCVHFYNINKY